ncbi:MAG: HEPN domain-containing protein [Spirochaetales bacterium]|jgi:HEPN domain-containing protein|nr:HEPN domain-containing protein [Spirochaetales bacterium]
MHSEDVKDWLRIGDEDFDSARILNESARKHCEIICYLCAQAIEKYLKGYLAWNDVIPEKTHNLTYLNRVCTEKDKFFENIKTECDILTRYSNDIRYPHKYEVNESDANFSIEAVEEIRNAEPINKYTK